MVLIDNKTSFLKDDLVKTIEKSNKISIAAACFSMYAYNELKEQLQDVEECRFIFTSPTFVKDTPEKQKREFYIPKLDRENVIYGLEFEVKLRNELTQKAIAKECAEWIRNKVIFKSNVTKDQMDRFIVIEKENLNSVYTNINGFTTIDLGCERGIKYRFML
ncbi:hypothetical protein [uncultured Gemella sp.]|uniref:hypothetical protein n=1 Tax=uncultured Gemella sp. TaxID=254352 RepID=UPI0028D59BA7|nr:hypothetical protein [uncultured Gemella sp.]